LNQHFKRLHTFTSVLRCLGFSDLCLFVGVLVGVASAHPALPPSRLLFSVLLEV